MSEITKDKRGRKPINVTWPIVPFTVQDLSATTGIGSQTLYHKLQNAVKGGILQFHGLQNGTRRKRHLYKIVGAI